MIYQLTAELVLIDAMVYYMWAIGLGLCTGLIWALFFMVLRLR